MLGALVWNKLIHLVQLGQVKEPLHLNPVTGTHVTDVIEIGRRRDHLRTAIVIPVQFNINFLVS